MSVTIKDIAKRANVSHATVSRALRGHSSIPESTSLRIQKIADDMAYVPNTVARGLKTKRSQILGVVVRRIDDVELRLLRVLRVFRLLKFEARRRGRRHAR